MVEPRPTLQSSEVEMRIHLNHTCNPEQAIMTDLLVGNAMRMDELRAAVDSSVELAEERKSRKGRSSGRGPLKPQDVLQNQIPFCSNSKKILIAQ